MKQNKFVLIIFLIFTFKSITAQIYFSEGFEGGMPSGWSNIFGNSWSGDTISWRFQNGGYTYTPQYIWSRHPYPAYDGTLNALFRTDGNYSTKLVTKNIDLSFARKPYLKFWYAQDSTYYFGALVNDQLKVYYRKSSTSAWVLLAEYTQPQHTWTQQQIALPSAALTKTCNIAFEGRTNSAYGVCVDDVQVVETDTLAKTVQTITASQASQSVVVTNSPSNPIIRLNIFVLGNSGNLILNSLDINSLNSNDLDIKASGIKLYSTSDSVFLNPKFLAQTNFSNKVASFNSLNDSLNMGNNFLWVTYDINGTAIIGDTLDAKIISNSINIAGNLFPNAAMNPTGSRSIIKSAFFDDYETNNGWSLSGFQLGVPQGLGGTSNGYPDPSSAFSGTKEIGNNLSGDYPANLTLNQYTATSPLINCKYFKNTKLAFERWLNVDGSDRAAIQISTDGGANWTDIWLDTVIVEDNQWKYQLLDISSFADRNSNIEVRFTLGPTNAFQYSGWNIDNFAVYGDYIAQDVGISNWITPTSSCGNTNNDSVKVTINNYAAVKTQPGVPLYYSFDNGVTKVFDTLKVSIPVNGSTSFTFRKPKDLSTPNIYPNIVSSTSLSGDQDLTNNEFSTSLITFPTYNEPFTDSFDSVKSFWVPDGSNSNWTVNPVFITAYSGNKAWESFNNFNNGLEKSYVQSPCIHISDTSKIIIDLKYYSFFGNGNGAAIFVSTDNGATWNLVPKHSYPWSWNWYNNNNVKALKSAGWDTTSNGWVDAKQVLPSSLLTPGNVLKFRIVKKDTTLYSDADLFAIDDFSIYEAPANIELVAITSHKDTCINYNPPTISFSIKNNGIRTLIPSKDKIIAGFRINNRAAVLDTLTLTANLPVNQTAILTFNKLANIDTAGANTITVFDIDPHQGFYPVADKDTISLTLQHLYYNPPLALVKQVASARLDTITISVADSTNYNYKWGYLLNPSLSTTNELTNPPVGKVWLSVDQKTDPHQCTTTDTVNVIQLQSDLKVDSIMNPISSCSLGNAVHVLMSVKNSGTDTLRSGDTLKIGYKFQTLDTTWRKYKLNKILHPGDTINYQFTDTALNMSTIKAYSICAIVRYKNDKVPANDTMKRIVNVWGFPVINLGSAKTVPAIDTLHAGPGFASYSWSDGSTDSIYEVRSTGYQKVKVTDIHGCITIDSVKIIVVFHDIKPTAVEGPNSSCSIGLSQVKVSMRNIADTIKVPEVIKLFYSINNNGWVEKDSILGSNLLPSDSIVYTFKPKENFTDTGTYKITFVAHNDNDIDHSNDTLVKYVKVYGFPSLNLGNDTTIKALQYKLSINNTNNLNFVWKYDSTANTFTTKKSDTINVKVTNTLTSCASYDTIKVTLAIKDGSLQGNTNSYSGCYGNLDTIKVNFINTGNIPIASNDTVYFWYGINGKMSSKNLVKLPSSLQINGIYTYTFTNLKNKFPTGNSIITLYSSIHGDLKHTYDSINKSVTFWTLPPVDLKGDYGDTITTTPPYKLQAPTGSYSYIWQDNSALSYYVTTNSGDYHVKVTDNTHSCINSDSVYVKIYIPDGGITSVNVNMTNCNKDIVPATLWFKNMGTTTQKVGDPIYFDYKIKTQTYSNHYTLNSNILPGDSISYTIGNIMPNLSVGANTVKFFSVIGEDIYAYNDTTVKIITINPLPNFTLEGGLDTATLNFRSELGTGLEDAYSYLWNTGATIDPIIVETSKEYSVTAKNNTTGCISKDSTYIKINDFDIGVTSVALPSQKCDKNIHNVTAVFTNLGNTVINANDTLTIDYTVNGTLFSKDSILNSNLLPGNQIIYPFPDFSGKLKTGENGFNIHLKLNTDMNPDNDTLTQFITIFDPPVVNIPSINDTIKCYKGKVIHSGNTGNYSFNWTNGHTTDTISLFNSGKLGVTVTDLGTKCTGYDSVYVNIFPLDGAIIQITGDTAACKGSNKTISVNFENNGAVPLDSGSRIIYNVLANASKISVDTVYLSSSLASGATLIKTFDNTYTNLNSGSNTIYVSATMLYDANSVNNSASLKVNIYKPSTITLAGGADTTLLYPPYHLDAGLGNGYIYLWQDGSTNEVLTTSSIGKYKVTATNKSNGCISVDSIYIILARYDAAIASISPSSTTCINQLKQITIGVKNNGNIILSTNDTVNVSVTVNKNTPVTNNFIFASGTKEGNILSCAFGKNVTSLFIAGTNSIHVKSSMRNDINASNDTLTQKLNLLASPVITLAGGKDTVSFSTSYSLDAGGGFTSYLWNNNSTKEIISASVSGWYLVTVTASSGCSAKDSVYLKKITGIDAFALSQELKVYPNPATVTLNIDMNSDITNPTIEIFSTDTKQVYHEKLNGRFEKLNRTIEIGSWEKGIYFVRIFNINQNKYLIQKVVIQ
jgi:hypothetical protein